MYESPQYMERLLAGITKFESKYPNVKVQHKPDLFKAQSKKNPDKFDLVILITVEIPLREPLVNDSQLSALLQQLQYDA